MCFAQISCEKVTIKEWIREDGQLFALHVLENNVALGQENSNSWMPIP
jgi:hypothetical protein